MEAFAQLRIPLDRRVYERGDRPAAPLWGHEARRVVAVAEMYV